MQFKEALIYYLEANEIEFSDKETKLLCQCLSPTHEDKNMSAFIKLDEKVEEPVQLLSKIQTVIKLL